MYSVLDQKLCDAYMELKCEPIIAIIEPNMYMGKFDWAKCVRPSGTRNYVKEILHNAVCVHAEVGSINVYMLIIYLLCFNRCPELEKSL